MKRRALGKGLDAIISNKPKQDFTGNSVVDLDVDLIFPNPFQPRKVFDEEKISELAASISESGLIQPVVVYKRDGKYCLVVGERRWRAVQKLKWGKIPAIIKEYGEDQVAINALLENIQREDLNAMEIAEGLRLLLEEGGVTHELLGQKIGMNRTTVTNFLRLLKLPKAIQDALVLGDISQGHARALLSFEEKDQMMQVFGLIISKNLSVRQAESLVKQKKEEVCVKPRFEDPDIRKIEEQLARYFSTKVVLSCSEKGKGKIEFYFNTLDEYERIYQIFVKENGNEQV